MAIASLAFLPLSISSAMALESGAEIESYTNIPISHNYNDIKSYMTKLAVEFPKTVRLFTLGKSDFGEPIVGAQIGDGNRANVRHLLVATHHGNEYGSTEVAKAFALSVAQSPIPGETIFVVPVLNITGYNHGDRYEVNAAGERLDPNRDYPGPCGTSGPFKLKSTAALAQFIDREGIVGSATLHTYSPAVVYPWGISSHDLSTPYDDIFKMLVNAATVESHYEVGRNTEVIYPADGAFEDYAYWKDGIWSILFELGTSHYPSDSDVREMQAVNVPGMRRMFQQTPAQRAPNHQFTGRCDTRLRSLDLHEE
jgi:predicted deacylase